MFISLEISPQPGGCTPAVFLRRSLFVKEIILFLVHGGLFSGKMQCHFDQLRDLSTASWPNLTPAVFSLSLSLCVLSLSLLLSILLSLSLSPSLFFLSYSLSLSFLILPLGKSGLRDLSMTLEVKISLSEAPISRRRKFVGIRPEK
jgi:hypothetical protein